MNKEIPPNLGQDDTDSGKQLCPLCNSEVRYFFIKLNEAVLMCENQLCEYPFGYEDLIFVKADEDLLSDEETELGTILSSKLTISVPPVTCFDDIDNDSQLNDYIEVNDLDANTLDVTTYMNSKEEVKKKEKTKVEIEEEKIKQTLEETKELNSYINKQTRTSLRNTTWIKRLAQLQKKSHKQLLSIDEMEYLKEEEKKVQKVREKKRSVLEIKIGTIGSENTLHIDLINKDSVSPPENSASPPKASASPPKASASPPKDNAPPPKDSAAPLKGSASPPKDSASSLKDSASPLKDSASPLKDSASPPKDSRLLPRTVRPLPRRALR